MIFDASARPFKLGQLAQSTQAYLGYFFQSISASLSSFNFIPNNKFFDITKWKAFAEDKLNVAKMTISLFDRIEHTGGNGENTPLTTVFSKSFFFGVI